MLNVEALTGGMDPKIEMETRILGKHQMWNSNWGMETL